VIVEKIDENGEVVAIYPSIMAAAKAEYYMRATMAHRIKTGYFYYGFRYTAVRVTKHGA